MNFTVQSEFPSEKFQNLLCDILNISALQLGDISLPIPDNYDGLYVSFQLIKSQAIGTAKLNFCSDDESEVIRTSFMTDVRLEFYGRDVFKLCVYLQSLLQSSAVLSELKKMGLGLLNISDILDLSVEENKFIRNRVRLDVQFSHTCILSTPLNRVEVVPVSIDSMTHQMENTINKE